MCLEASAVLELNVRCVSKGSGLGDVKAELVKDFAAAWSKAMNSDRFKPARRVGFDDL
jgi:catalase (peroxidase I)